MADWTFFSNHGHIIILLGQEPDLTLREVAARVGITERATQKIIADLEVGGFIKITKRGRRNHYRISSKKRLKHDIEKDCRIGDLITLVAEPEA